MKKRDDFPIDDILECCTIIEKSDNTAMASDGPILPTAVYMTDKQIQQCLTTLWKCRRAAIILNSRGKK